MEITQLRTLVQVADLGSLSKAAARLRIAQPALSRQVRLLEEELGVRLFERQGRGMALTDAGRTVLGHAKRVVREMEALKVSVADPLSTLSGHVAIGLPPTIADLTFLPLVAAFRTTHPDVTVRLVSAYTGDLLDGIQRGDLDIAVLYDPHATRALRSRALMLERLFLIGPGEAGLSVEKAVSFTALAGVELLLPSRRHGLRVILESLAAQVGIELDVCIEIDSYTALKDLVRHGYGWTILPLAPIHADVERGELSAAAIVDPAPTRRLVLSYPSDRARSRATSFAADTIVAQMNRQFEHGVWSGELLRD